MSTRHARRPAADDADALLAFLALVLGDGTPRVASGLDTVLLGDEALECTDGDRGVDLASPAGVFTRGGTHPTADRRERVRQPSGQIRELVVAVGNRCDICPGVGVDGTGRETWNVLVVEAQRLH